MTLVTLVEVKEYLKINSDSTDDNLINTLIVACSQAIEDYCERTFIEKLYGDEEYDGSDTKYLLLRQYPVKTVTSVEVDGQTLDPSEYKVKKSNGTLIRTSGIWPKGDINISVTYTAGFTEIPAPVKLACKHLVMSYFKADIASFSTTFGEGFVFRPEALPAQVKALVQPYKKVM